MPHLPLLEFGPDGAFDDHGMSSGCLFTTDTSDYLFYLGWNLGVNVPFRNSIGLAISPKGKNEFKKISSGAIMDRDMNDPYSLSYPYVIRDKNIYKMWYGTALKSGSSPKDMIFTLKICRIYRSYTLAEKKYYLPT